MRTSVALLAAASALALAACSGADPGAEQGITEPVRGGVLEYGTDVQPVAGGIDPYSANSFAAQNINVQIYESLLTKDAGGKLQPGLAESWEQPDETTYRFDLREATFSNGEPLTVEDVVFSYQTMASAGAGQSQLLRQLASVTAIDEDTVEFRLSAPNATFINVAAGEGTGLIVNKKWYTSTPDTERQRTALGTGPFKLASWEDNVVLRLDRNEHYWQEGLPYLDGVNFRIFPDEQARLAALRQGTVDAIWLGDQQLAEQVEGEGISIGENAETRTLNLYIDSTSGPTADLRIRQAVARGLDREQLALLASYGYGKQSLVVPVGDPSSVAPNSETPNYAYDPDGARELLAQAGADGVQISLTYPSDASFSRDVALYEVMKEQLKEVGIDLVLNPLPWADVLVRYVQGNFDGMISIPGTAQTDVSAYFSSFLTIGAPTNTTGAAGTEASALLTKLVGTTDPEARTAALRNLEHEVAEEVLLLIPYVVTQRQELWSNRFQGYAADPYSFRKNLKNGWLVP